jgi:hypothetical protein
MLLMAVFALHLIAGQDRAQTQTILDRAVADFERGRIAESVAGFDQLVKVSPQIMPQLWQRGIALYAHLYRGLYFEAIGDERRASEDLTRAASDRYRDAGRYMHLVARVHVGRLGRR